MTGRGGGQGTHDKKTRKFICCGLKMRTILWPLAASEGWPLVRGK